MSIRRERVLYYWLLTEQTVVLFGNFLEPFPKGKGSLHHIVSELTAVIAFVFERVVDELIPTSVSTQEVRVTHDYEERHRSTDRYIESFGVMNETQIIFQVMRQMLFNRTDHRNNNNAFLEALELLNCGNSALN